MLEPITAPALAAPAGVAHGFFTRHGGVSQGIYRSLNCGLGSGDDTAAVRENRSRVAARLGASDLITAHQIHSPTAVIAHEPWAHEQRPRADAIVTGTPGLALGVLAADCAPVLFAAPDAGVIAAAHAGWRGALGGVLEAAIEAMLSLGARRDMIVAAVGPCIGPGAYEVGGSSRRRSWPRTRAAPPTSASPWPARARTSTCRATWRRGCCGPAWWLQGFPDAAPMSKAANSSVFAVRRPEKSKTTAAKSPPSS